MSYTKRLSRLAKIHFEKASNEKRQQPITLVEVNCACIFAPIINLI
jgi:hypothetical protein